jgi:hypothetical protein
VQAQRVFDVSRPERAPDLGPYCKWSLPAEIAACESGHAEVPRLAALVGGLQGSDSATVANTEAPPAR